jgi:hypothetical protein
MINAGAGRDSPATAHEAAQEMAMNDLTIRLM